MAEVGEAVPDGPPGQRPGVVRWAIPLAFLAVGWPTRHNVAANTILVAVTLNLLGLWCIGAAGLAVARSRRAPRALRRISRALLVAFVLLLAASMAVGAAMSEGPLGIPEVSTAVIVASSVHLFAAAAMTVAILAYPGPRRVRSEWPALVLDLTSVVGAGAVAYWYLIAGPALRSGAANSSHVVLAVAMPIQDLLIACAALLALLRGVTVGRRSLEHLIAGTFCLAAADSYVAYCAAHWPGNRLAVPVLVQAVMVAGMTQFAVALRLHLQACRREVVVENTEPIPGVTYVPYLAVLSGFGVLGAAVIQYGGYPWTGLTVGTILMTTGMGARQLLVIRAAQRLATTDSMTGLSNRRAFIHGLERCLEGGARGGGAVLLFDLNGFKQVNDRYGHSAGDAVLAAFAGALRRNVLGTDVVGRLGGDEFAVLLHDIGSRRDAASVTERILADLAVPVTVKEHSLTIRTSVGITLIDPADGDTTEVLHRADQAMYQAKSESPTSSSWRVHVAETPAAPLDVPPPGPAPLGRD